MVTVMVIVNLMKRRINLIFIFEIHLDSIVESLPMDEIMVCEGKKGNKDHPQVFD